MRGGRPAQDEAGGNEVVIVVVEAPGGFMSSGRSYRGLTDVKTTLFVIVYLYYVRNPTALENNSIHYCSFNGAIPTLILLILLFAWCQTEERRSSNYIIIRKYTVT